MSRNQVCGGLATAAVLLGLALGFHEAGSPRNQRLANADVARIDDLTAISGAVSRYLNAYGKLPQSLAELSGVGSFRLSDPETRTAYEYHPLDARRFELCATFSTDDRSEARASRGRAHGAGRQCFTYPE